jgi:hypothetical protein
MTLLYDFTPETIRLERINNMLIRLKEIRQPGCFVCR